MRNIKLLSAIGLCLSLATILAVAPQTAVASNKKVCKEIKRTQCGKRSDCTWIKKNTTKKGITRKAHCRSSGSKK